MKDFVPVTEVVSSLSVVVIYPKLPVNTLAELIALAKAKPASLNYGVTGLGNASNLNLEMMKRAAGIEMQAVPYKGDAPLNTDLIAGQIQIAIVPLSAAVPLVQAKQLRALALIGPARSPVLPDVPTAAEALPPGFGFVGWQGWFVAGRTPPDIVARIQAEVAKAVRDPDGRRGNQEPRQRTGRRARRRSSASNSAKTSRSCKRSSTRRRYRSSTDPPARSELRLSSVRRRLIAA